MNDDYQSQLTSLDKIMKVHYGKALKKADRDSSGKCCVWGSSGNVGFHTSNVVCYPTIIIGRKGSVGATHFAANGGWPIDTTFYIELLNQKSTDLRYLFYALRTARLKQHTITTSIPGLSRNDIYKTKIYLPPLAEQKRIAAILDKADGIRCKKQEILRLTDELLKSTFLEMFGDPVTNPKGWPVRKLGDIGKVVTGNTPSRAKSEYYGHGIEWIKSDNINTPHHYLTKATEQLTPEGKNVGRTVKRGAILVTCIAGSPSCIGNAALANREVAFNQQINAIQPHDGLDPYFLYTLLLVGKKLIQRASTNSMKGMVSKGKMCGVSVPIPNQEQQTTFRQRFEKIEKSLNTQRVVLEKVNIAFNSLVQKAFRGELVLSKTQNRLEAVQGNTHNP